MTLSQSEITSIMLSLGVLLASARLLGELAKYFRQPSVVGEIFAGIILGPTILGALAPDLMSFLVPTTGTGPFMSGFFTVAVSLFLLVAGMEVDLTSAFRQGKTAIVVSVMGICVPFALGFGGVWLFPSVMGGPPNVDANIYALFVATALSISALPVIAKTLMDMGVYRTDIGMIVIAAAMLNDLVGWLIFAMIIRLTNVSVTESFSIVNTALLTGGFVVFMLTIGRALLDKALPTLNRSTSWPGGVMGFTVALAFIGAAFTEWIGIHAVFGAFMVGVALGDSSHLRQKTKQTIEQFVSSIFAPLFFASIGLKINFTQNFDLALVTLVLALAVLGKVSGCAAGAAMTGFKWRDAAAIGFGMNSRGAMEMIFAAMALQYGIIDNHMFVALVVMAIVTSMISGPAMRIALGEKKERRVPEFFSEAMFINPMKAEERGAAIAELSALAADEAGVDSSVLKTAVLQRERLMPTGLDGGVAIPHAKIKGLAKPLIGVGLSKEGIDFDAADGTDATLIFLILTPESDNKIQVEILASLSKLLKDPVASGAMKKAQTFAELMTVVRKEMP